MTDLLIGRQPILNRRKNTIGYELLYRAFHSDSSARFPDGNTATSRVFANTMFEMGLENIVGENFAFINFTRDFLVKDELIGLLTCIEKQNYPPEQIVLEVLEDISIDDDLFQALRKFKQVRFKIALDDVVTNRQIASILPTGLVDIVKVDLMKVDRLSLPSLVRSVKEFGIALLAEKVETPEDFHTCMRLGFDFFQGYFFSKPETIKGQNKKMDVSRINLMRSLAVTMNPMADFAELNPIISQDIGLSYKLLRLVNSGYFSLANQIKSIPQAVSLIGLQQLRSWMMLLMLATVDDKPHELTMVALQRARMCELLSKSMGRRQTDTCFLIGLLSILDAILDAPMEQVVNDLCLVPEIADALVNRSGTPGMILEGIIQAEDGNWNNVLLFGIKPDTWSSIYFESVKWANHIISELNRNPELQPAL